MLGDFVGRPVYVVDYEYENSIQEERVVKRYLTCVGYGGRDEQHNPKPSRIGCN